MRPPSIPRWYTAAMGAMTVLFGTLVALRSCCVAPISQPYYCVTPLDRAVVCLYRARGGS